MAKIGSLVTCLILVISLIALGLRFVHLEADFPPGIDWSGDLYTDEGWYSNSAIVHQLTGQWIIEGDFNPVVYLPVFQLAQGASFSLFGLSLTSARLTVVIFSILVCVMAYLLATRMAGPLAGLITLILLSTSFTLFAFSRLAILDLPMTAFTLLALLLVAPSQPRTVNVALASVALAVAALTKTTALFALPALMYLIWTGQRTWRRGLLACCAALVGIGLLLGAYYALANVWHHDVVMWFLGAEFPPRLGETAASIAWALARAVWRGMVLDSLVYPLALLSLPVFLIFSKRVRGNRMAVSFTIWLVFGLVALGVRGYLPPRYYLPLSAPVASLFSLMVVHVYGKLQASRWSFAPVLLIAGIVAVNLFSIGRYLSSPRFSFVDMADDVRWRIYSGQGTNRLLVGNMANSITLATGIPSINSILGTRDLGWKLGRYRPGYYVALGEESATVRQLSEVYDLEELSSYDVFANYYSGKRVTLYRLLPRPSASQTATGARWSPDGRFLLGTASWCERVCG
jgi:4-amino-4-deoxy-L-arabinose transferase-like glycosyltransferase